MLRSEPSHKSRLPDLRWAVCSGVAGIVAVASYISLVAVDVPLWSQALLTFGFGGGFVLASIGLHYGVTLNVAPRLGLLAAIANTVAAGQLTAMLLVQAAVRAAVPHPDHSFIAIWLGLDVAWDLFGGAGTALFALALWRHPRFGPLLAAPGVILGLLLVLLNALTFPIPPAEAGLFDIGPFAGLWYLILAGRVLFVALSERARATAGIRVAAA